LRNLSETTTNANSQTGIKYTELSVKTASSGKPWQTNLAFLGINTHAYFRDKTVNVQSAELNIAGTHDLEG